MLDASAHHYAIHTTRDEIDRAIAKARAPLAACPFDAFIWSDIYLGLLRLHTRDDCYDAAVRWFLNVSRSHGTLCRFFLAAVSSWILYRRLAYRFGYSRLARQRAPDAVAEVAGWAAEER